MLKKGNNIFSLLIIILSIFMTSSVNIVNADATSGSSGVTTSQTTSTTIKDKDGDSQLITKAQLQNSQGEPQDKFDLYETIRAYWEFKAPTGSLNDGDTMTVKVPDQLTITGDITDGQPIKDTTGQEIGLITLNKADRTLTVTFNDEAAKLSKTGPVTGSFYISTNWDTTKVSSGQNVKLDWIVDGNAATTTDYVGSGSSSGSGTTSPTEVLYKYGSYIGSGDIIEWTVRVNYKGEDIKNAVYKDTIGPNQTLIQDDAAHPITINSASVDTNNKLTNDTDNAFANLKATNISDTGFTVDFGGDLTKTAIIKYYTKITDGNTSGSYANTGDLLSNNDEIQNITINQPVTTIGGNADSSKDLTSIMGHKLWSVPTDTKLPDSVTINLLANNTKVASQTVTKATNWSYVFSNLRKYADDGKEISYTVTEDPVAGFTSIPDTTSYDITNILSNMTVTKKWNDDNNRYGIRTDSVMVGVFDGSGALAPNTTTIDLNAGNQWTHTFNSLPANTRWYLSEIGYNGKDTQSAPAGYIATQTTNNGNEYDKTLTNTLATTLTVTKAWDDNNATDRPTSVQVQLYKNDNGTGDKTVGDPVTLNADNKWTYTFGKTISNNNKVEYTLPKYDSDGNEITYHADEVNVPDGYTSSSETTSDGPNTNEVITNSKGTTPVETTTNLKVNKVWNDSKTTHDPITVHLLADKVDTGTKLVLSEDNKWTDSFKDLPTQKDGKEINYTVSEDTPKDYDSIITPKDATDVTITNTPKDTTPTTRSFTVTKKWAGDTEADRPASIKVYLIVNDVKQTTPVTITAADGWKHTWNDLAVNDANGKAIKYEVSEDADSATKSKYASNIDPTADGATITNTLSTTPSKNLTHLTVTKAWNDDNNKDGHRPESVQVQLLADGKSQGDPITLNSDNHWTYTWNDLDKQLNNKDIDYSVSEKDVSKYYQATSSHTDTNNITLTNTYTPVTPTNNKRTFTVTKYWNDENNKDELRPSEIKVQLTANGKDYGDPIILNAKNGWTYTWNDLDKQSNNTDITYYVKEAGVPGYVSNIDLVNGGAKITNTHTPKTTTPTNDKTHLTVTKAWNDKNDKDKLRPSQVVVQLLTNGKAVTAPVTLNSINDWSYTWNNLDKNNSYTVVETPVTGYSTSVNPVDDNDIVITNTHQPRTPSNPGKPQTPDNPGTPTTPTKPVTPTTPTTPVTPTEPGQPGNPGLPWTPSEPSTPKTPNDSTPALPTNPLVPTTPSQPTTPVTSTDKTGSLLPQTGSKAAWIYSLIGILILGLVLYLFRKIA